MRAALEPDHAAGAAASGEPAGAPGPARGASPRMRARVCPRAGASPGGGTRGCLRPALRSKGPRRPLAAAHTSVPFEFVFPPGHVSVAFTQSKLIDFLKEISVSGPLAILRGEPFVRH